jgi:hypothetical protein
MSSATVTNDFTNGLIGDADEIDQNFSDLVSFLNTHVVHNHDAVVTRHGVRLHKAVSAVASGGSGTAITWGDEREDTDAYWTSGASITIPSGMAGVYAINFSTLGLIGAGRAFGQIRPTITSGLVDIPGEWRNFMDAAEDRCVVDVTTPLGVGDSFVCEVFHSTGASVNFESWVACYRISV